MRLNFSSCRACVTVVFCTAAHVRRDVRMAQLPLATQPQLKSNLDCSCLLAHPNRHNNKYEYVSTHVIIPFRPFHRRNHGSNKTVKEQKPTYIFNKNSIVIAHCFPRNGSIAMSIICKPKINKSISDVAPPFNSRISVKPNILCQGGTECCRECICIHWRSPGTVAKVLRFL